MPQCQSLFGLHQAPLTNRQEAEGSLQEESSNTLKWTGIEPIPCST